ncbi:MAG: family 10 glycosylhydrolase [Planctomycetota bacterium]
MSKTLLVPITASLFLAFAVGAAQERIAVVRGTFTEERDAEREGRGVPRYLETVTSCLKQMSMQYDLLTDADVEAGKLAGRKFAFFPYNPQRTEKWVEEVLKFIDGGGKVFIFCSVDPKIAGALGFTPKTTVKQKQPGDFASIKFVPGIIRGVPELVLQGSWNILVVEPTGDTRVLATWLDAKGADTGYPAVLVSDKGFYMSHVLLPEDLTKKARFLFACVAHFIPDLWPQAAERRISDIGKVAGFASIEEIKKRLEAEAASRQVSEKCAVLLGEAETKAKQADALAKEQKYEEAIAAAEAAHDAAVRAYAYLVPCRDGECRGVWMPSKIWTTWDAAMQNLKENGFNAAFPHMCSGYTANYESEVLQPSDMMKESGDQLKLCLEAAKKHGIQVHVWRVNWRASGAREEDLAKLETEGRLQLGVAGEKDDGHDGRWLCPSHPLNQKHEIDAMVEIVRKYHPDGIHFDYIRYPNSKFCYCPGCRERFEKALGQAVAEWPKDVLKDGAHFARFDDWRRDQITQVVAAVSEQARKVDPRVKISAAVFRDWAAHRQSVGQDWKLWCEKGYLDFVCPMDYTDSPDRFRKDVVSQVDWVAGTVPLYPGIGAFSSSSRFPDPSHLLHQVEIARNEGADGFLIFHYNEDLATRFLPALRLSATAKDTFFPHDAPKVRFEFPDPFLPDRPRTYRQAEATSVKMTFADGVMGRVEHEGCDGRSIASLDAILAEDKRERTVRLEVPEGRSRIALYGQIVPEKGDPVSYVARSAPIVGLSQKEVEEIQLKTGPAAAPPGAGIRVGVAVESYGGMSILNALRGEKNMRAFPLYNFIPDSLAACDVIVIPQLKEAGRIDTALVGRLREFVEKRGGGLVVTHDAVGYRNYPAIIPEIAAKGTNHVKQNQCKVIAQHPITAGLVAEQTFEHTYYDHVLIEPGAKGTVVVADAEGKAVVVAGEWGSGRYVADGMATGLGAANEDVPVEGAEKQLLVNMVRWAGKETN